jgi:prepilin-type processing-associated H-X9-DG protein/prepilin-type N-terminal cleavage/methylation domain-containing protein
MSMVDDHREPPGFTLIEVLLVIGIISLLVALTLPLLGRSRQIAKRSVCGSNLRQIGIAITMYGSSNRDWGPPWTGGVFDFVMADNKGPKGYRTTAWTEAIYPYLGGRDDPGLLRDDPDIEARWEGQKVLHVYCCPGRPSESRYYSSYFYNALSSCVEFLSVSHMTIDEMETSDPGCQIAVNLRKVTVPSTFILAGDIGTAYELDNAGLDWDHDNASLDQMPWGATGPYASGPGHGGGLNVLFLDGHVDTKDSFVPGQMTYAYDKFGVSYADLAPAR